MLKRQVTQFDTVRNSATVATPTCSSCCCCCCCLTTTLASSTLLARRIDSEARLKRVKDPIGLTTLAVLYLPIITGLTYLSIFFINHGFGSCQTQTYSLDNSTYQVCTTPGNNVFIDVPIAFLAAILVLTYLYMRVRMNHPVRRAIIVTLIIVAACSIEFIGGAAMILAGAGIVYLIMVPFLIGFVIHFYNRKFLPQPTPPLPPSLSGAPHDHAT